MKIRVVETAEITYQVARTKVSTIFVSEDSAINAFDDLPDTKEYQLIVKNIEPNRIFVKAPSIYKLPATMKFVKLSLKNIKGAGIENREYTRKLRFDVQSDESTTQFFADSELSVQQNFVEVTFSFDYKNLTTRIFENVPVDLVLPPWCIQNFVSVEKLPDLEIAKLKLQGRADALQKLKKGDVRLKFVISESGIDKQSLEEKKSAACSAGNLVINLAISLVV